MYVDDIRLPARVGRISARWSHLSADTIGELHSFADRIGLRRSWFQARRSLCRGGCPHWHYDVTDTKRRAAIAAGAVAETIRDGAARRDREALAARNPPEPDR